MTTGEIQTFFIKNSNIHFAISTHAIPTRKLESGPRRHTQSEGEPGENSPGLPSAWCTVSAGALLWGGEPTTAGGSGSAPKLGGAPAMIAPAIGGGGGRRPG